ncbi:hypothetical protein L3V77_07505 [Vibrio sp. DW001]|uniref:hypothetical protein n=1 Tax=Vibrio sp. DW001 TaxID=2912315 RepID=UPI0023AEFA6C|nr:hypothetical protein [Vibrio sp. DW001]WED28066.1 hypothetical protein L3V77_07505 [Vibrio sp. DW001]
MNLTKPVFLGLLVGKVDFAEAVEAGYITLDGDAATVPAFFGLLNKPAENPKVTLR